MTKPKDKGELSRRNLTIACPHCGDRVSLLPASDPISTSGNGNTYFIGICPNYERLFCAPIFCVYEDLNNEIIQYYPVPGSEADNYHTATPLKIREDYAEATRCFYVKSYKGCVVMCRRIVDAVACDQLGAEAKREDGQTKRLTKLIEMMQQKGLVTNAIKESADEIRFFGDYGAHTQDDGLDTVSWDDAFAVRQLTLELLKAIYITPYETQRLRRKREA